MKIGALRTSRFTNRRWAKGYYLEYFVVASRMWRFLIINKLGSAIFCRSMVFLCTRHTRARICVCVSELCVLSFRIVRFLLYSHALPIHSFFPIPNLTVYFCVPLTLISVYRSIA